MLHEHLVVTEAANEFWFVFASILLHDPYCLLLSLTLDAYMICLVCFECFFHVSPMHGSRESLHLACGMAHTELCAFFCDRKLGPKLYSDVNANMTETGKQTNAAYNKPSTMLSKL